MPRIHVHFAIMADELDVTCEKLDELLKEFLVKWNEYHNLMAVLSNYTKDGFLSVSKAKYSMGVSAVSELQVPDGEFKALVEVSLLKKDHQSNDAIDAGWSFELSRSSPSNQHSTQGSQVAAKAAEEVSGVRKRFVSEKDISKSGSGTVVVANSNNDSPDKAASTMDEVKVSGEFQPDPLKWFGFLVPSSLRQGQQYFKRAVDTSVELANLKITLSTIIDEYMQLKQKKKLLLSSVHTISSNPEIG